MTVRNNPGNKVASDGQDGVEKGKSWPQILAILICCLAPLTTGLHFSWTSPFIVKISQDKENYDISEEESSLFTVLNPIAMLISGFLFSDLNDKFGRKSTILLIAIPYSIAWILLAVARNIWTFYAGRIFAGIGDGLVFSSVPMYIGEISSPKVRSSWGNVFAFHIYLGQFFINVLGGYLDLSIATTSYICITIPIALLVIFSFMPESPYYYLMKGRLEEAKKSMRWLTGKENVEEDFVQLKSDVERQMSERGSWKDLFFIPANRKALLIGIFLRSSQQLAGISIFATYTQFIFQKSGGEIDPTVSSMIFSGSVAGLNLCAGFTLERIGRKRSYILSLLACGVTMLIESIYFYLDQFRDDIDVSSVSWLPVTGMMLWVVFFSIGLGIVPTLMLGELFSASIKSKGLCFLLLLFALQIGVLTKLFYFMTTAFGLYAPFLMFSLFCFVSTVIAFYLVPETKGKTLEQIQQSMNSSKSNKTLA